MTTRERKEARLERRLDWAESRDAKSAAAFGRARTIADGIPLGQPILVGHHSEKHARADQARIEGGMARGVESMNMAEMHRSKAAGIQDQLDRSIYSDDEDAVGKIRERIAGLEAKRDRMKRINAEIRRGAGWEGRLGCAGVELTAQEKGDLLAVAQHQPYYCKDGRPVFPPYALQNLAGNIGRLKERIRAIEAGAERTANAEAHGGVLIEGEAWICVTFAEKPGRPIIEALKAAGFRWGGGHWIGERAKLPAQVEP